jgi:hypothetical protein
MTATLLDKATFWASFATLWAAAFAWATYFATVWRAREDKDGAVRTVASGLKAELDSMRDWVGEGYEPRPLTEREELEWSHPGRVIFTFNCPSIHGLTTSPYIKELEDVFPDFIRLSRSITRFFNYYEEYRRFANSRPLLYDSVVKKTAPGSLQDRTEEEGLYSAQIVRFNTIIHHGLIGGAKSKDPLCLYHTFYAAEKSINRFIETHKRPAFPWWYYFFHALAVLAFAKGAILAVHWLGIF